LKYQDVIYRQVLAISGDQNSTRALLTPMDLNGLDYSETAQALSIPIETLKSRVRNP
jgi:DNA-directed RNA polymerase specialized sigma24 family protein